MDFFFRIYVWGVQIYISGHCLTSAGFSSDFRASKQSKFPSKCSRNFTTKLSVFLQTRCLIYSLKAERHYTKKINIIPELTMQWV